DDVTERIRRARARGRRAAFRDGPPGRLDRPAGALGVLRAGDVHLAGDRADRHVLGTIERRRAETIGGLPAAQQDVGLRGEPGHGRQRAFRPPDEGQPLAAAVPGESRDVQGPRVEQPAIAARPRRIERIPGDELVEVLERLVVAHVDRDSAVAADGHRRALVLEAPEGRALPAGRTRVEWVDLDDPAELQGLERVRRGVEARVYVLPTIAAVAAAHRPARQAAAG